jgi:hypothetical protein
MKPEYAHLVQTSLDRSLAKKAAFDARADQTKTKRVNMLTQNAMAGDDDEEQA